MQPPLRPTDEARRLDALRQYHLLDTLPEQALDDLTALAAHICEAPISLISLVDEHRQWFKSTFGLCISETPREAFFCGHVITQPDVFIVPDAAQDERFADNPLVTGDPHIRFYAGAPLVTPQGEALGTLCVIDCVPRQLMPSQQEALRVLSRQVMAQLELRRQTRELFESEAQLRLVTDNARVGLVIVNHDRRYEYANSAYAEILGLPSSAIVGQRVSDVLAGSYEEQIRPRLDRAFAGESISYELRKATADGHCHYAITYEPTTVDGSVVLVVVVISDITERKQAEELVRISHERFQIVARATNDAVWDWNLSTNALSWNEGYQTLFGYLPEETDPSIDSWARFIHPDDADRVVHGIHDVIDRGGRAWSDEYRFRRRDGTYAEIFDRGQIIHDVQGRSVRMVGAMQDVTERRQAEVASSRLAAIVESSDDAIIGKDLNSIIASWNMGAAKLFGYTADEMVGTSIMRLIPADRQDEEGQILEKIQRGEGVKSFETLRQTRDGRLIDVSITASPIKDATGTVTGVSKVARDITERKDAEEAQRASEARYRTLFEYAPDGIVIADRESCYIDANASMCRMLGYSRDELIGRHASDIVAQAEVQHIGPALRVITAASDYHREWQFRRKDGSAFAADVIATVMPGGNLVGMVRDVTERNQAIEALRTAEERMRFALQSADVGIWDMDYTTGVLQWSEILEAQHGLQPGTFGGTFEAFVERIHPDDRELVLETVGKAMKAGTDFSVHHRTVWPDGTVRWLSGAGRIHLGEHREPVRGVGISLDVTERRTLEEQFQQAQKMEAIGRLAGGVAHDFNNLLTVILGYCELLLADLDPDDLRQADIAEIQTAGARGAGLTRQLLAFSRKEIIEPMRLDLNVVVADMRAMLGRLIGEDVKVVVNLRPELAPVIADRGQVEQIVMNLAVNARDAMPKGGTLTIETANVDLDEPYARTHLEVTAGPYVALTVTDTGTGMTPDVQARLFEPFFTTKALGKGTGLGLATVHGIVMRSGGSVTVDSEVGKGTSFKVYFPPADATAMAVEAPPVARPRAEAQTVLVVEDADGLRELTKRLLERQGYTVLVAANADEALRVFEGNASIDVLLTDVVMPGGSGPELTRRLVERRPALKVIFMSGYTEDAIVHHGVLNPGIAFLHKPFTSETLGRKIREVLDR
jgi:two-component system cell cycle sensor histidine kinase/response regulator CckA